MIVRQGWALEGPVQKARYLVVLEETQAPPVVGQLSRQKAKQVHPDPKDKHQGLIV